MQDVYCTLAATMSNIIDKLMHPCIAVSVRVCQCDWSCHVMAAGRRHLGVALPRWQWLSLMYGSTTAHVFTRWQQLSFMYDTTCSPQVAAAVPHVLPFSVCLINFIPCDNTTVQLCRQFTVSNKWTHAHVLWFINTSVICNQMSCPYSARSSYPRNYTMNVIYPSEGSQLCTCYKLSTVSLNLWSATI